MTRLSLSCHFANTIEFQYDSIDEVLTAARQHHSELTDVIDAVLKSVEDKKARTQEAQAEKRQKILSLSASTATLELLRSVVEKYGPDQLVADRHKSHKKVRLVRKMLSSCSLMDAAFGMIRKAESLVETGTTVDKISKSLQIDRRSSLPHPKWTLHHDSVLLHAIVKHGWLDSESSCRSFADDKSITWGPPFDRSFTAFHSSDEEKNPPNPPAMIEAVAERACTFLNNNKELLHSNKTFNPAGLIRTFWLEKHRPADRGDTLADADSTRPEEDYKINREALLQEETDNNELVELPTRKELQKRAKTLLSRAVIAPSASAKQVETTTNDHPYTVLDQSNPCNAFLAQLIRGMVKAPVGSDIYKALYKNTVEEAESRKADISALEASTGPATEKWGQQRKDLQNIIEHVDIAKRTMSRSARLGKNVLRAIIGEDPQQPKNPNESLFPIVKARLKVVPKKNKQVTAAKSTKPSSPKKSDSKLTAAESAVAAARQKNGTHMGQKGVGTADLTEVETAILQTASYFGVPGLTKDWKNKLELADTNGVNSSMTWVEFGRNLVIVSKARLDEASQKFQRANKDYEGLESKPNLPADKRDVVERTCYLAELNYEAAEIATGQAADYSSEPETLAKKTIMTLGKVFKRATKKKAEEDSGARVFKWMVSLVDAWATELELVDEKGQTLTLTAVDFLKDLSEAERSTVQTVTAFDANGCAQVVGQIAVISRLRMFFEAYQADSDSLQAHLEQAVLNIRESWVHRPDWWTASDYDMLLIKRLVHDGFEGFQQTKIPYGLDIPVRGSWKYL